MKVLGSSGNEYDACAEEVVLKDAAGRPFRLVCHKGRFHRDAHGMPVGPVAWAGNWWIRWPGQGPMAQESVFGRVRAPAERKPRVPPPPRAVRAKAPPPPEPTDAELAASRERVQRILRP